MCHTLTYLDILPLFPCYILTIPHYAYVVSITNRHMGLICNKNYAAAALVPVSGVEGVSNGIDEVVGLSPIQGLVNLIWGV